MPITAYKLVEYLVNIHLMLFEQIQVAINVTLWSSKQRSIEILAIQFWDSLQRLQHGIKESLKSTF